MPTPNFSLPTYGPGDTSALDTLLNGQSSAIDAALLAVEGRAIGTAANRTAMAAPRRKEGLQFYETDTDREWRYDGSAWQTNDQSAFLIRPTGTNGTILPNGHVTTGVAGLVALELQGVFTPRFRRYMITGDWTVSGGANGLNLQFMNGATVDAAAQYYGQNQSNAATSVNTSAVSAVTNLAGVAVAGIDHAATWMIFAPAEDTLRTRMTYQHQVVNSGTGISIGGGAHLTVKAHDGIVFRLSTTTGRSFVPEGTDFAVYGLL